MLHHFVAIWWRIFLCRNLGPCENKCASLFTKSRIVIFFYLRWILQSSSCSSACFRWANSFGRTNDCLKIHWNVTSTWRLHFIELSGPIWPILILSKNYYAYFNNRSCLKLFTNYHTTMLTKFKTGVGFATIILKLQDHLSLVAYMKSLAYGSKHDDGSLCKGRWY